MKKTLSILAVAALAVGTTLSAADKKLTATKPQLDSPTMGAVIAPSATLINSATGNVVIYDINEGSPVNPPFEITKGYVRKNFDLVDSRYMEVTLEDVSVREDQRLVIDFSTYHTGQGAGLGGASLTDGEYLVIMFNDSNFAEWYEKNPTTIVGHFTDGDYTAYVIDDTCDQTDPATTYGGLVFFNKNVAEAVSLAEVDPDTITPAPSPAVPEPTTATLSLLALAGLAARRRRR